MSTQLTLSTIQDQTPTSKNVVMDVRDITKTLPLGKERINILKGISFQIMSGEFVSIVGPSGSGKSTYSVSSLASTIPQRDRFSSTVLISHA